MIAWLAHLALSNAVVATALACVVLLVSRYFRRPAITHTLWVLVLVKLVTPPLIWVPVPVRILEMSPPDSNATSPTENSPVGNRSIEDRAISESNWLTSTAGQGRSNSVVSSFVDFNFGRGGRSEFWDIPVITLSPGFLELIRNDWTWSLWQFCIAVWGIGALCLLIDDVRRLFQFGRLIALLGETCEGQCETARVGQELGLQRVPKLVFLNAPCTPMLWGVGPWLRVIFPKELWEQLSSKERATLIAHELAHYSRGDHYVRILELGVRILFWWHPVVSWACREVEAAEEECCDTWVVDTYRGEPLTYARALLRTLDYISTRPVVIPPTQTGITQVPLVESRLRQIMYRSGTRSYTHLGLLVVGLLAMMWLPLTPFPCLVTQRAEASVTPSPHPLSPAETPSQNRLTVQKIETLKTEGPAEESRLKVMTSPEATQGLVNVEPDQVSWGMIVSPGSQFRLRAAPDGQVFLENRRTRKSLSLTAAQVTCATFFSNDGRLLTGSEDGTLSVWNCETGLAEKTLITHSGKTLSLAINQKGTQAYTASLDGNVVRWDLSSGQAVRTWRAESGVKMLRLTPSGTRLVLSLSGDDEGRRSSQILLLDAFSLEPITNMVILQEISLIEPTGESEILVVDPHGVASACDFLSGELRLEGSIPSDLLSSAVFSQNVSVRKQLTEMAANKAVNQ